MIKLEKNSLHKGKCRIPKGVIHIRANSNNTIVIVTNIRGQAISWSSMNACGSKGMKKIYALYYSNYGGNCYLYVN
jgi:small subunit ribosomal protein S11